jgi:hypothetical protein
MRNNHRPDGLILLIILIGIFGAACSSTPAAAPTPTPRDDSAIRAAVADGVHGDTYDLSKGPNTYCARCKSPVNWDPEAVINPPPNCVSCKFPSDTNIRVALGNPVVPENTWQGIRCSTCHPQDAAGQVDAAVAWWDPVTDSHVPQSSSTDLCEQCHRDTALGTMRQREIADSVAHADATCTTCHDPHSGAAACANCHNEQDTETAFIANCWEPYLAEDAPARHTGMLCVTCHDNGGLELRPVDTSDEPFQGQWATWRTGLIAGVIPTNHVWVSHNLSAEVDCGRCHYAENDWGLSEEVVRP